MSSKQETVFWHECQLVVRWGDLDAYGHVNNAFFFKYFESARFAYFEAIAPNLDEMPIVVLADIHCKFEQQIHYPAQLIIKTKVTRLGNSSFDFYCEIWNQGKRCASSESTMVWFDENTYRPKKIPDWFIQAVRDRENLE